MVHINKFESFNASVVPLQGSNLIEASAGTGKTYSIAILVIRLLLEKEIPIQEILMVTFTKAAVAELEERIRLFVRLAYQASNDEIISDEAIKGIVNISNELIGKEAVKNRLRNAIIFLDETAVLTIHSFCQQTLSEFAFETDQLFGVELLQDTSSIIENEVNKFWRKHITSIPVELLVLLNEKLSRNDINKIAKNHLDGKLYNQYSVNEVYSINQADHITIVNEINELNKKFEESKASVVDYIVVEKELLRDKCQANAYVKNNVLSLVDDAEAFLNLIEEKRNLKSISPVFEDLIEKICFYEQIMEDINKIKQTYLNKINYAAINEVAAAVKNYKLQNNQVSFDDLISNLHNALVKNANPKLAAALQKKYKAVFIDEFQDTDRLQFEVFDKAFGTDTILFYIGDPKQSIYAFRKADIATYFRALDTCSKKYGMNENYRSSKRFIEAMNLFFQPSAGFDTFHFSVNPNAENRHAIEYIRVNSPFENTKGFLKYNETECVPISICKQPTKPAITDAVAAQVIDLLSNKAYSIFKAGKKRQLQPSDIGILVRSNSDGKNIKNQLTKYGIPAVTIGDAKVLQSATAVELLFLLEAMIDITRSNINRALLCSLTSFNTTSILSLNDETAIELFKKYKTNWDTAGIYATLINFVADFKIQDRFLNNNAESGERIITNLYQLIELLHKTQTTKNLSPLELIEWLKRGIKSNDGEGDEYEQRIENDEECVKIVTIHKSKGLEYNIVLAPFLDFVEWAQEDYCSYRNQEGEYINLKKKQASEGQLALYREQTEQENRRLLYVAITRAVYKCFIYKSNVATKSTLSFFTNALSVTDKTLIEEIITPEIPDRYYYKTNDPFKTDIETTVNFHLLQTNWARISYTGLAAEMEKHPKVSSGNAGSEYDQFIFNQLTKGSKTGNMLHYIFENINFNENAKWATVIDKAIKRFSPAQSDLYEKGLAEMVQHVLNAAIQVEDVSFNLSEVNLDQRIHEFEFDFPVILFQPAVLKKLSNETISINVKSLPELEGIMNGKIDMLFKCRNKYFVLDWKSTFLGDSPEQYAPAALNEAMNESNYHLQYLIYTLATKKYLENRIPGFDYEKEFGGVLYLFVRGMRKGTDKGVFYCKPALEKIEKLEMVLSEKSMSVQI